MQNRSAKAAERLRMLEVGALSVDNMCSKSGLFDVSRIDLHSETPGIEQQDFMMRPMPSDESEKFDIISLSLVLNYVANPEQRGEMLRRTCEFLAVEEGEDRIAPLLFLVLPAPCVNNSRYLNEERLVQIMKSLGYSVREKKCTAKLAYYLWSLDEHQTPSNLAFRKEEVHPGKTRNNFCILLNH